MRLISLLAVFLTLTAKADPVPCQIYLHPTPHKIRVTVFINPVFIYSEGIIPNADTDKSLYNSLMSKVFIKRSCLHRFQMAVNHISLKTN